MEKKFFTLFFMVFMIFLLSACTGSNEQTSNEQDTNASTNDDTEATEASDGDFDGTITIGAVYSLSGMGASYGELWRTGTEMAVNEINENGGLDGKELVVDYQDGQGKPKESVQAAQNLAGKNVPVILTGYTGATLGLLPIAERNQITVINGGAQGNALAGASPYLFNTIPLVGLEVEILAKYLGEETDFKTIYVLYVNDDSGKGTYETLAQEVEKYDMEIIGSDTHELDETNYRSVLIKAKDANADVLYIASHGNDAKLIIDQARDIGIESQLVINSWSIIPEIINNPNAEGVIHTTVSTTPRQEWLERYKAEYGDDNPSSYIINYYDAVMMFAEAYNYAQENGYGTDGEAIRKAIDEIRTFESAGEGELALREDGTVERPIDVGVFENNESKLIKQY